MVTRVQQQVRSLHPYQVPEIISVKIAQGNKDYMDWVYTSTTGVPIKPAEGDKP